jgi:hypothetical protein
MEETISQDIQSSETENEQDVLPYKHCLNCGTELKGMYCHICGQEATDKIPTVSGFVTEYFNNAFIWDTRFFPTFWTLIRRPGHLTKEFLSGKFVSQEHPLKLNMFLLFVFITLFVFFASAEKMTDSVQNLTTDELLFPGIQFELLLKDQEYAKKMQESPRDTVYLQAPLFLTELYPEFISNLETKEDTGGEAIDKWIAVLPQVLITDQIIVIDDSGYYYFNTEAKGGKNDLNLINSVWAEMVRITSQYFPILLLLTVPFLSISLSLVQRKSKLPRINHFIFTLHYTAFLEALMICIYILHLTIAPSMEILEGLMAIGSCTYLTIAFRRVYATNWGKAIAKSLLTSLLYLIILLSIFIVIFFIACFIIATNKG